MKTRKGAYGTPSGLSRTEEHLRFWMAISAFLYFGGGFVFLFLPHQLLEVLDSFAELFHLATVLPGAMPAERFWNFLAFSMAMTIATASDVTGDFCTGWNEREST
ncbi:MAG: hypothetical protein ACE5JX_03750 [Acidobacteriota bacterium]